MGNPLNPSDEFVYNRWAEVESAGVAAHTVPLVDDRVLMLHPGEPPAFNTPDYHLRCQASSNLLGTNYVQPPGTNAHFYSFDVGSRAAASADIDIGQALG